MKEVIDGLISDGWGCGAVRTGGIGSGVEG